MVDHSFYTESYLGEKIPEKHFPNCMARAQEALACFDRRYTVSGTEEERKLALCAMAEAVWENDRRGNVVSATTGSVSVRYGEADRRWRALYEKARIYLQICRGVS